MADAEQKFVVRSASISSKGLFATSLIKTGEVVVSWHPKVLTIEEANALPEIEEQK